MASLKKHYRAIFDTFGYPLTKRASMSLKVLAATEKRLGVSAPAALRDYYLVAGRERRFNTCHNRLLSPTEWRIDNHRLIFMAENQGVVWWGVSIRNPDSADPPVSQAVNDEPLVWVREHRRCSEFLAHMLHYQAVSGGFRHCAQGDAPEQSDYRFEENGWTYYGEIGGARAYSRPNQVVCLEPFALPSMDTIKVSVLAGGKTKSDLRAISDDLGVALQ